ncbi:MAG: hypothetical protein ACJAS9_000760 [Polaribacter sp.]|jgi:hypothetical protein
MKNLFSFTIINFVKLLSRIFYRFDVKWLDDAAARKWDEVRLIVFLNHTSLFEPIFLTQAPTAFTWRISKNIVVPGADITINRPIVGRFFKWIAPGMVSITRKRDSSWKSFMQSISKQSIVAILPEGRMKRKDGLDKHGKPMTVRGGIAEILSYMEGGKALFVYSGGLHHVQIPGQKLPNIFKKVKVNLEMINIDHYKEEINKKIEQFGNSNLRSLKQFRLQVIDDLNDRLKNLVPK